MLLVDELDLERPSFGNRRFINVRNVDMKECMQTPSLQRSVSGVGGYVTPRNGVEPRTPGKTPSGSGDKKMRRVNTILHSSPSLSSAYSVSSPPSE
jgi:hypothetical protein